MRLKDLGFKKTAEKERPEWLAEYLGMAGGGVLGSIVGGAPPALASALLGAKGAKVRKVLSTLTRAGVAAGGLLGAKAGLTQVYKDKGFQPPSTRQVVGRGLMGGDPFSDYMISRGLQNKPIKF